MSNGRSHVIRLCVREATPREYYSMALYGFIVSRQKWLIQEYLDGRIDEKQFLEALLVRAPNHPTEPNDSAERPSERIVLRENADVRKRW